MKNWTVYCTNQIDEEFGCWVPASAVYSGLDKATAKSIVRGLNKRAEWFISYYAIHEIEEA